MTVCLRWVTDGGIRGEFTGAQKEESDLILLLLPTVTASHSIVLDVTDLFTLAE